MWLYFSAAVLLLGAEFSAARARMHDPRGAWGQQNGNVPPGSRAKIGSLLAASTRANGNAVTGDAAVAPAVPDDARRSIGSRAERSQQLTQQARKKVSALSRALTLSRKVVSVETTATRATAEALIGASRKATQANAMVRRHPWRAVLLAASAGMAVAMLSGRDARRTPDNEANV
jgi:membrane protein